MPPEPSSPFQTPVFNEAGQDMLNWTQDWQRRRRLAALAADQNDADAEDSGDDTIAGGGGDNPADSNGADSLYDGEVVVLPDGSKVPDSHSPTGFMMSPVADLSHVAAAGREMNHIYSNQVMNPETAAGALPYRYASLFLNLHHGGTFDYQRQGNWITGYKEFRQFANLSNFNIGLFSQQAGLTLDEALSASGLYAHSFSSNAKPDRPYGLDPDKVKFIQAGYDAGKTGMFGQTTTP